MVRRNPSPQGRVVPIITPTNTPIKRFPSFVACANVVPIQASSVPGASTQKGLYAFHNRSLSLHSRSNPPTRPRAFSGNLSAVSRSRYKVQTYNGTDFTKRFQAADEENLTLFERELKRLDIVHRKIRPYTPRHNGKVERSHRKDNEEFYATHTFYSFKDFKVQLTRRNREYNNFPMCPPGWKSPREALSLFLSCATYV